MSSDDGFGREETAPVERGWGELYRDTGHVADVGRMLVKARSTPATMSKQLATLLPVAGVARALMESNNPRWLKAPQKGMSCLAADLMQLLPYSIMAVTQREVALAYRRFSNVTNTASISTRPK